VEKEKYNRNTVFIELGGFLWWVLIRFTKTDLKKEQSKKYGARNVLFIFLLIFFIAFMKIKVIDNIWN
jgi:hypothetical protein